MKIGVVGNGMIVERFLKDAAELETIQIPSICVRENSRQKGAALAATYGIPQVETSYPAFLLQEGIDAVYLGISNHVHYPYAKAALEAGKHVICEKPFTVYADEAKKLALLARKKGLFLWEAFKIPYSPIFNAVKEHLPKIGRIKLVQCNYSRVSSRYVQYKSGQVLPAFDPKTAGGCLYDINLYNLHFVTGLFGKPKKVVYHANKGFNGVDTSGVGILEYDGFHAVCCGAKDSSSPCGAVIQGEDGYIQIDGPVSSAKKACLVINGTETCLAQFEDNGQLTEEIIEFERQFREQDLASCLKMLEHSLMMMEVVDLARTSAGLL